ncbi:ABC transporter permease [Pseudonocardia eucalypti]|uniref:ABC transporter permease n=1 Tax=Pseudonocardia eucalypti TaxID=648755 RepID=A0ABP9QK75_9PSEU
MLFQVGHMGVVGAQVARAACTDPRTYWADTRDDMYYVLRRISVPAFFALIGYGLLAATFAVAILIFLGAANRLGTVYLTFIIREISPLLTSAVVAGAIGAATTSELGSRKIREELDALRVLGQDPIRLLVLPRVISLIAITLAYNILGILMTVTEGLIVVSTLGDVEPNSFLTTFMENITVPEIIGNLIKMTLIGLLIGVISASKGMTCGYGAEGVGRAVNQSVVICLTAAYAMDVLFNMILLATNPSVTVLR